MSRPAFSRFGWQERYFKPLVLGLVTLLMYWAAINRSQALPWAIAAMLSATLVTGLLWPRWLVGQLSVVRHGPARADENETIVLNVEVINRGFLPRFMIEVSDVLPFVGLDAGAVNSGEMRLGVATHVPGGGIRKFELPLLCEKRGLYRLGPVGLVSSFPLGLVEARQSRNDGVQHLTIYPAVFPIATLPLHGAPSQIHRGGYLLPEGAGAAEFSGLRDYRRGDNPRHIHWPTTARLNALMIKEFEPLASACLHVVLDQCVEANVGCGKRASFEVAIRIAASIARYACDHNIPTRLIGEGADGRSLSIPSGTGGHHYQSILDELAIVAADGAHSYATVLEKAAVDCHHGETVVVFLSELPTSLAETLQTLALLRARGAHLFAVVFERGSFLAPGDGGDACSHEAGTANLMATLHALGATALPVCCGDDLVKLFNS